MTCMCGVSDHKRSAVLRAGVALEILRGVIASGPHITEREEFALLSPIGQTSRVPRNATITTLSTSSSYVYIHTFQRGQVSIDAPRSDVNEEFQDSIGSKTPWRCCSFSSTKFMLPSLRSGNISYAQRISSKQNGPKTTVSNLAAHRH